jgi:hypothetical protein
MLVFCQYWGFLLCILFTWVMDWTCVSVRGHGLQQTTWIYVEWLESQFDFIFKF